MPDLQKWEPSSGIRFKEALKINQNCDFNDQHDSDEYLSELLKILKIKSLIVGVGGAGCNTISRLESMGVENAETLIVNTDAHDLYYSNAKRKLLIGKERCNGLGSGNDPVIGFEAAEEDVNRLKNILRYDIIFLLCGLGGGTGTGAAPIIAREAKKNNALVVTFCSIPFKSEGAQRRNRAKIGLKKLAEYSDTLIPLPNDNLLEMLPNMPLLTCFKIMDEVLVRCIQEVVNLINNCGIINLDFADVRKIFEKSSNYPSGLIGITETLGSEKDLISKSKLAIHYPLLKLNTKEVNRCLVSVSSDHHLPLSKVDKIVSAITEEVPQDAKVKLGAIINPNLKKKIRIMCLGKGPISPFVRAAVNADDNIPFQ